MAELRAEIAHNDKLYFQHATPAISDADYDRLKRELAALEQAYPQFAVGRSAGTIGDDRSGRFPPGRHRARMFGLAKSYSRDELRAFHDRVSRQLGRDDLVYVVEPKFDGVAISVTYEHGRFRRAVTRGNGLEGDDVTANVATIRALPHALRTPSAQGESPPLPDLVELRGEIFIGFAGFRRINAAQEAAGEEPFANPRNLAAGTLKLDDPAAVAARPLEIVFYGIGACEPPRVAPHSQQDLHALIKAWGLPGVNRVRLAGSAGEVWNAVAGIGRERRHYAYPTDGAVVKIDDVALQQQLGTGDDVPNWAMAYKFAPERIESRLRAIALQVGRTGVITPVAELEPVRLGGATITRASLYNFDEIRRRDIRVGDFVLVEKAGEIIPSIAEVVVSKRAAGVTPYQPPRVCPSCGTGLVRADGETALRCPNATCAAQLRRRIAHFASDACADIDGLGPVVINRLVERGAVKSIADLYRLRRDDLLTSTGAGGKTADRVLAAIERSKRTELSRVIDGLGIPEVGRSAAQALATKFPDLPALVAVTRADLFDGSRPRLGGLGRRASESVLAFFAVPENRALVAALLEAGLRPAIEERLGETERATVP